MIEKFKSQVNKKYATISAYVIVTVAIIFALFFVIAKVESIFKVIFGVLGNIFNILSPVFIGIVIAYILDPLVAFFEKVLRSTKLIKFKNEKSYRSIAVFTSILVILLLLFILLGIFVFSITKQISTIRIDEIANIITNYINGFSDSLKNLQGKLPDFNIESKTIEEYITKLSTMLINWLKNVANNLADYTLGVSGYITNYIFAIIIAIYLLLDKDDFIAYGNKFVKAMFTDKAQKKIKSYWKDFDYIFSGYIRGQLLDALFMSVALSLSLSIVGIKFGALIGVLAGICNLIPYFGPIVAFIGTIFFGLLNAQYTQVVIAIIVLLIVQQIDGNIVGPRLLGKSVSLKPVFILIAVIVGAQVGGALGMVLAVPIAALISLFVKRYIDERIRKKELVEKVESVEVD